MDQDKFQPWPVFWIRHDEARLIARSLVRLDEKKRLSLEGAFGPSMPAVKNDPAYRTCFLTPATRLEGNWTSVVTQLCEGYYHWLMDALPHLVMLPELPADTRIIVPPRLAAFQLETLQWLNLEGRCRPTPEKHLLVEHYYFCRPTSMTGCYNPYAVEFLRRSFLHHADESFVSPRRFYLRRVGKIRPIINEAELLEFFQTRGWAIVDTEQMSLSQQIRLFSQAEMICAPHGAGLTNLLWCQPGCKVLELCTSSYLNGVFEGLAQCVGANYRYLIFKGDYGLRSVVNIPEIAKALDY
jgi:capsular polysaccharide biosynthesis protein